MTRKDALAWRLAVIGLLTMLVAVAGIDLRATYGARLSVDEPQYLLTAISIGEDFDLDVSDELRDLRFLPFHERRNLNAQTIELNQQGQRLSPHDPLLPTVLALPMRVGGWVAARLVMAALVALTAMATLYAAIRRFDVAPTPATVVVGLMFASPPLITYGNQIYPAIPAALCLVLGVIAITDKAKSLWWVAVVAVIALPWLSVKYAPHAAVLALSLVWAYRDSRRILAAVVAMFTIAGIQYLVFHQLVYGGWTVYASGDHFIEGGGEWEVVGDKFNPWGRTRRLVGLIVDKGFGLAAWAPIYLATPAVLTEFVARRRPSWQLVLSLFVVGWAMATWIALTMHGWWWPGRQVVPILPLVIIALAAAADRSQWWLRAIFATSLPAIVGWLWLVVETSTDRLALIVDFEETSWPFYRVWRTLLPDHRGFALPGSTSTTLWTLVLIGSCAAAWWTVARQPKRAHEHIPPPVEKDSP